MSPLLRRSLALALVVTGLSVHAASAPETDLDAFMRQVLAKRDDNWRKLQQYVLDERETFQMTGPDGGPLYGFRHDYAWFMRDGYFVRSPLRIDGVTVGEPDRRKYEQDWLAREQRRETRRAARAGTAAGAPIATGDTQASVGDAVRASMEPRFVSAAYFLKFKFEPGHYALAGREALDGRPVLKIEYYPARLFDEGRTRPAKPVRDRDDEVEERLNKVSLVTLWVEPASHQIVRYTFDIADMGFLPGRSIARVESTQASMRMGQPFPGVWLPQAIDMRVRLTTALGAFDGRYDIAYHDYREANVTTKVR